MVWLIINIISGKQAKEIDGTLTPIFENHMQALNYISKRLNSSPYLTVWETKNK